MLIKSRNFSPTKTENTFEKDGFGWAPGQEKKFEGTHRNSPRYGKNYSRIFGTCRGCDKYTFKSGTAGEHCSLPANEHCQK
jgi:hypothetical protein